VLPGEGGGKNEKDKRQWKMTTKKFWCRDGVFPGERVDLGE